MTYLALSLSRVNRLRSGPSTATSKKNGRFKNGATSSYVRRSVVTVCVSQLRVTCSSSSAGEGKVGPEGIGWLGVFAKG